MYLRDCNVILKIIFSLRFLQKMSSVELHSRHMYDGRIHHPSTMLICGPSGSGKTHFTQNLLEYGEELFKPKKPAFTILIYDTWQNNYDDMLTKSLIDLTIKGLPDIDYLKEIFEEHKENGGTLLLIDDQMQNIDQNVVNIFTIYSHHMKVTCILLTQSLFLSNKAYRTISLNTHYIILMKNTRDSSSVTQLAKQTHPFRTRFITDSYIEATKHPYSYLMFDLRQETPEVIRIRSNIFSDVNHIYIPK